MSNEPDQLQQNPDLLPEEPDLLPGEPELSPETAAEAPEESGQTDASAPETPVEDLPEDPVLSSLFASHPEEDIPEDEQIRLPQWFVRMTQALREHRRLVVWSFAAAVVVCIVCIVLFGGRRVTGRIERVLRYAGDKTSFSLDVHSSNSYLSFHRGLAVASPDGLQCFNARGEQTVLAQCKMDNPVLLQNRTVALGYGVGSSSLCTVHHSKGEQINITVPGTIIDADLSGEGYICCASAQPGYKTVLTVYDGGGNSIYTWLSSTQFFGQCAVSDDGRAMCAIALGIDGGKYASTAVCFATDQETPVGECPIGSDVIFDLRFVGKRDLCAVGETALHFFDTDSGLDSAWSYEGGELLAYDMNGDGFIATVRNMNQAGARYRITTVSAGGEELASLSIDEPIQDLSANGAYLAVLTSKGVQVYDSRLRLCLSEEDVGFATRVCVQRDGAALLIDGSSARRVS